MRIGTEFAGKIKDFNNQYIETQFFLLGIPLFPLKTMFVTEDGMNERSGFEININTLSVLKGFLSNLLFVAAFVGLLLGYLFENEYWMFIGGISLVVAIVVTFFTGKPDANEREERALFHLAVGINALPSYLKIETLKKLQTSFINEWRSQSAYEHLDWKHVACSRKMADHEVGILFAIIAYELEITKDKRLLEEKNYLECRFKNQLGLNSSPYKLV